MHTSDDVVINPTSLFGRRPLEARGTKYKIVVFFSKKTAVIGNNAPIGTFVMVVVAQTTVTISALITMTSDIVMNELLVK